MNELISMYGNITAMELMNRENNVLEFAYDPNTPIDVVFNRVQDFQDLCELVRKAKTDDQLKDLAYIILQKTGAFTDSLKTLNARSAPDPTDFAAFRVFMRAEHRALNAVDGLKVSGTTLQNNLLQEIHQRQQTMADELENKLQANFMNALGIFADMKEEGNEENIPPTNSMNKVSEDKLLKLIEALNKKVDNLSNVAKNKGNNNKINPRTGNPWKRYCWTCGCCDHWGKDHVGPKADGHQDKATFKNRMGGSDKNCLPARS